MPELHKKRERKKIYVSEIFFLIINYIYIISSLYSSVVEHWSCKPGVVSSNLTGGIIFVTCFIISVVQSFIITETFIMLSSAFFTHIIKYLLFDLQTFRVCSKIIY